MNTTILLLLSIFGGLVTILSGVYDLDPQSQDHFSTLFAIFVTGYLVARTVEDKLDQRLESS